MPCATSLARQSFLPHNSRDRLGQPPLRGRQRHTMEGGDEAPQKKFEQAVVKSNLVDHTYYDYSTFELHELLHGRAGAEQKGRVTFPMKLHVIISKPEYRHIICWMPHGRSWKVLDKELIAKVVCKENFNHENFASFIRSVNGKIMLYQALSAIVHLYFF